jgi:formate hydrogenlyase transcriptional activator
MNSNNSNLNGQFSLDINSLPFLACITHQNGLIEYANNLFVEALNTRKDAVLNVSLSELFSPAKTIQAYLKRTVALERGQIEIHINDKKKGKVRFIANTQVISEPEGTFFILWAIINVTKYHQRIQEKQRVLKELDALNAKLLLERDYLRDEHHAIHDIDDMIGNSPALLQMIERIQSVAETNASVLITGESGSGKELVARLIHKKSNRKSAPLVTVNCASIPSELFESEFFGHIRGAFSGAIQDRIGRFELANTGTLFLDEVGEIPIDLQSKLLRTIQQKSFERVGENITKEVDVRIIAATNRNLEDDIDQGLFREDLYYRLSVFPISVPPLRKRKEDIIPLANFFLESAKSEFGKQVGSLTTEQLAMLQEYHWPGNIRELKNVIERAVILSKEHVRIDLAFPEQALREIGSREKDGLNFNSLHIISDTMLKEIEKNNIVNALEATNWKISGKKGAANLLEVNPSTLSSKVKALKIKKPEKNSLYNRLGGIKKITPLVDELLAKLRSDEQLGRHWKDRGIDNIRMEKKYVVDYFCDLTGGPFTYTGRNMVEVHKGMGITEADWKILAKHIIIILSKSNLSRNDAEELLEIVNDVKDKLIAY